MSIEDFTHFCKDFLTDDSNTVVSKVFLAITVVVMALVAGALTVAFLNGLIYIFMEQFYTPLYIIGVGIIFWTSITVMFSYDDWRFKNNKPRKTTDQAFPG